MSIYLSKYQLVAVSMIESYAVLPYPGAAGVPYGYAYNTPVPMVAGKEQYD